MPLWLVAFIVFLLNLPFGFWRAKARTFSLPWILAVHLPVPIVIALRIYSGLGWQLISFPILIAAFFLGQFTGGKFPAGKFTARDYSVIRNNERT